MLGLWCSTQARAAFVFGFGSSIVNQTGNYILGDNFAVNSPVTITQLGVFDQNLPPGAETSIPIAIYVHSGTDNNSGWTLVPGTSYSIASTDSDDVLNQTRYISIAPVTLGPGVYSIVTATSSDYNSGFNYPGPSTVTFDTLGGKLALSSFDIWASYGGGGLPPNLNGMGTTGTGDPVYPWSIPVFGAGTFSTVVPEASTIIAGMLLLLPLGASIVRILRKRTITAPSAQ